MFAARYSDLIGLDMCMKDIEMGSLHVMHSTIQEKILKNNSGIHNGSSQGDKFFSENVTF